MDSRFRPIVDRYDEPWHGQESKNARKRWREANGGSEMFGWKCAMLLLGQDRWIRRRVESVSFTQIGTTRRHLSFDFTIPEELMLRWNDGNKRTDADPDDDMLAVPLSFFGKGDLVHLDVRSQSGESVSVLESVDGREVLYAALKYCFHQIPDADDLLRNMNVALVRRIQDPD